jgi:hypothetical protein
MITIPQDEYRSDFRDVRETLQRVQPALRVTEDGNLDIYLRTILSQIKSLEADIGEVADQRFVETATGEELERLGEQVGVERKTGEADSALRRRIRAAYAAARSTGTYEDIAQVALLLLDADPSEISIVRAENTGSPGTARVEVPTPVLSASPLSEPQIVDILGDAAVGGHRIQIQQSDVFTWDDSSLGWGTDWGDTLTT